MWWNGGLTPFLTPYIECWVVVVLCVVVFRKGCVRYGLVVVLFSNCFSLYVY